MSALGHVRWYLRIGAFLLSFLVAVVSGSLLASAAQSLVNLGLLADLGLPLSFAARMDTVWHDWLHFAPTLAALLAMAFLPAFLLSGWITRRWVATRSWLFPLAGALAVACLLLIMRQVLGISAISATRTVLGFASFCLAGAVAGYLYRAMQQRLLPAAVEPIRTP